MTWWARVVGWLDRWLHREERERSLEQIEEFHRALDADLRGAP